MPTQLEELLASAARDPATIPVFLRTLLESTVLVPGTIDGAPDGIAQAGSQARFAGLSSNGGTTVQPFYTSEAALNDTLRAVSGFEARYVGINCRILFEMTQGTPLVLNPHSDFGKEFTPGEIAQLLDGVATLQQTVVEKETTVMVGVPAAKPDGMEATLITVFERHPGVQSAILGWKVDPSKGDQSYLMVITGTGDLRSDLSDDLGRALLYFSQAHPVDVMFSQPGASHLLSDLEPFYERAGRKKRRFFGR